MKNLFIAAVMAVAMLGTGCISASGRNDDLSKAIKSASKIKGAESVKIGKTLMRLGAAAAEDDEKEMLKRIDSMTVLDMEEAAPAERAEAVTKVRSILTSSYTLLMQAKDEGDTVEIYYKENKDGEITDLVIYSGDDGAIIRIQGRLRPEMMASAIDMADEDE